MRLFLLRSTEFSSFFNFIANCKMIKHQTKQLYFDAIPNIL